MSTFDSLGGVVAAYTESFGATRTATQSRILVLGPASEGPTGSIYQVSNLSLAENKFGVTSTLMQAAYELVAGGADNIALMRTGGRAGLITITNGDEVISITPSLRDGDILSRYALFLENSGGLNRLAIYDTVEEEWVFDSSELLTTDNSGFDVVGLEEFSVALTANDFDSPSTAVNVADMITDGDPFADSVTVLAGVAGDDGSSASLVEKYAALNTAYLNLSYRDAAGLIPVGVHIDDANVADTELDYGAFWKGLPVAGEANDKLGYVWQYVYQGECYTYFTDTNDYFTTLAEPDNASITHGAVVVSALKDGIGGNACELQVVNGAAIDVTVSETDFGLLVYVVCVVGTSTATDVVAAINDALAAFTLANGVAADTLLESSVSGSGTTVVTALSRTHLTGGAGGHVLTHEDLTGDAVPEVVSDKFDVATDVQLREVNFAHQLASAAYLASVRWQDCLGIIDFKEPTNYSASAIRRYLGSAPEYTISGVEKFVDALSDNGTGVLGHKLISGKAISGRGYRNHLLTDPGSNDGLAYGGLILTKGLSLPNAGKYVYGISDADEALDARRKPVDIGKHIFVNCSWGTTVSGWNGGTGYKAPASRYFMAKVFSLAPNVEAIGENGMLPETVDFRNILIPVAIQAELADARIVFVKPQEGTPGRRTFGVCKTAAHPSSDYTRLSTIRCVNFHMQGIREIGRPYQGQSFTNAVLMSFQAQLDQFCREMTNRGYSRGSACRISYTAVDRVAGNLNVALTIKPPYSIETIVVTMTISPD